MPFRAAGDDLLALNLPHFVEVLALQDHKCAYNKFSREFSKRCAFHVNLVSTFDNL